MTTETTAQSSAPSTLAARQREAVLRLVRVVGERAETQARIDTALAEATESAASAHVAARRKINAAADEGLAQAQHDRETAVAALTKQFDAHEAGAAKSHRSARSKAEAELDSAQRVAEEGLRDAAWLAEATYEGGAEQPKQELERVRGIVRSEFSKLDSIEVHASRLAGPRIPMPQAQPSKPDIEAAQEAARRAVEDALGGSDAADDSDSAPQKAEPPLDALAERRESARANLDKLRGPTLHAFVRAGGPIFLIIIPAIGAGVWHLLTTGMGAPLLSAGIFAGVGVAVLLLTLPIRALALSGTRKRLVPLAADLLEARRLGHLAVAMAEHNKREIERAVAERRNTEVNAGKKKYENRLARVKMRREQILARLDRRHRVMADETRKRRAVALETAEAEATEKIAAIEAGRTEQLAEADRAKAEALRTAEDTHRTDIADLAMHWRETMQQARSCLAGAGAAMDRSCPAWDSDEWADWTPPLEVPEAVRIGRFTADLAGLPGGLPEDESMMEGLPASFEPGALLDVPERASLLVQSGPDGRDASLGVIRNAMLRVLTALPAGKARLTMMDPVGLGQSFAGFMRLADHDERLVGARIWTEARHIEQRLADLTEHMETVIQKYLRNEFESIEAYNEKAGEIAEPYRFLVVADFPTGFTEESARRLSSIIESGPRCGVFVLMHQDPRGKMPETITQDEIDHGCHLIEYEPAADDHADRFVWRDEAYEQLPLSLESPPPDSETARLLDVVGKASLESGKVEVPFRVLAPEEDATWESSCADELRIPLGRAGATKLQQLTLGKGTSQHVLLAGKTGSGKSTLLHVMITAGALWYSPDELEFYLVDFKKGVEFKAYAGNGVDAGLPHARAIAVESDREFGLSVLHRLDDELKRRGDLFRDLGVQSIGAARAALKKAGRDEAMPRSLLVIDEFQEFFTEDDKIAQDAGLLLDRLVRQGRAFGMHVLLGSQTLSGAYSLARSTVGQMAVRIALQCSETDSYLILSEDNSAARLLNRPGEAIYNDANGMVEGNNPFQVCWLPDGERDKMLARVRSAMGTHDAHRFPPPIVFEGNVPADLADNADLAAAIADDAEPTRAAKAWVGDPVEIKPPAGALLRRQAGANLLVLGQQDETSRAMLASSLVGLAAQHAADPRKGPDGVKIAFLDSTPPDDPSADEIETIVRGLAEPGSLDVSFGRVRDAAGVLAEFDAERVRREEDESASHAPWYLLVLGLQRFRDLRKKDDDFSFSFSSDDDGDDDAGGSPSQHLADLLRDGPPLGLHVVAWVDTATSLSRTLDRQGIGHFEQRAVLQMSASDSSNLIDSPEAGKLGMNRGLLYNEELGTLEKFRPYRMPGEDLVRRVAAALAR